MSKSCLCNAIEADGLTADTDGHEGTPGRRTSVPLGMRMSWLCREWRDIGSCGAAERQIATVFGVRFRFGSG
nr:hypothetical protein [Kibdelosporangium sp. MJ126-NF4]CTQ94368.1 hypothetical protein [Kibdelosporangium sp. MJ126-NF4]